MIRRRRSRHPRAGSPLRSAPRVPPRRGTERPRASPRAHRDPRRTARPHSSVLYHPRVRRSYPWSSSPRPRRRPPWRRPSPPPRRLSAPPARYNPRARAPPRRRPAPSPRAPTPRTCPRARVGWSRTAVAWRGSRPRRQIRRRRRFRRRFRRIRREPIATA